MLQDIAPHALNNQYRNRAPQDGDFVLIFTEKQVLAKGELKEELVLPTVRELAGSAAALRFLFTIDDTGYYLLMQTPETLPEGYGWLTVSDFRQVRTDVPKTSYFAIMTGWHLYTWYRSTIFCGHCGERLAHHETLRMLRCPACGSMYFPKIAPAVIMGVTKGDCLLMSKYAGRSYTGFALLAGFVEIGETPEEAVAREVLEETGLKVRNVRYFASQPWGLDGNLSLGYFCELDGEDTITIDREELAMAQWYARDEIPVDDDGYTLTYHMIQYFRQHPEAFQGNAD